MSDFIKDDFGDQLEVFVGADAVILDNGHVARFVLTRKQSRKLRKALKRAEKELKQHSVYTL